MSHRPEQYARCGMGAAVLAAVVLATAVPALAQQQQRFADQAIFSHFLVDQLEYQSTDGPNALVWEAQGWVGGDYHRVWFKTEGDKESGGSVEEAELQLLYSRLVAPYWEFQVGLRHDFEPDPSRTHAVVGVTGLAPYWFEVDAAAFLSEDGDLSARVEAEYELLLTQKLVLQPLVEVNLAAQDVEELGIRSGFTDVELGLRLRYEIVREFAPYVGITWTRQLGRTADLAREEGEDVESFAVVAGLRLWY